MTPGAALVTGAAHRLGRAMALDLASNGWAVAVHYSSSRDEAEVLADGLRHAGANAVAVRANLLDDTETAALVPAAAAALGRPLTLLINNASIFDYDNIRSASLETWDRHIGSNLKAPFFLSQAFASQAPQAGVDERGEPLAMAAIINMVDQRVLKPTPEFITYALAKAALWSLTRTSAQALAPAIRVNAIGPGPTLRGARQSEERFSSQRASTILQRGANPADIVAAMRFILESPAFTGQLICVDGGQHLNWRTADILGVE